MNGRSGAKVALAIVKACAAAVLIVSFFQPWVGASFLFLAGSMTWMDVLQKTPWTRFPEADLVMLGAVAAPIAALVGLVRLRAGAISGVMTLLGFVAAGGGAVWLIAESGQAASYLGYAGAKVNLDRGLWLFLVAAVVGAVAAIVDLAWPAPRATAFEQPSSPVVGVPVMPASAGWGPGTQATVGGVAGQGAGAPGRLTVVESGRSSTLTVNEDDRVVVGREFGATIRVVDPRVSRRHAVIVRSGGGWVVNDLGATNPTQLLDPSGAANPVRGELRIASGQLLMGDVLVTLYPA
jgi:hypothetical protein